MAANNQSPFVRLSQQEIQQLYQEASKFVSTHIRTPDKPNAGVAPYSPQFVGQTHLTVPIHGVTNLVTSKELYEQLEETFGLDMNGKPPTFYHEMDPDGNGMIYKLNLPIRFHKSQLESNKFRPSKGKVASVPTLEWPLFLMLVEVGLCGFMYYRVATGVAF